MSGTSIEITRFAQGTQEGTSTPEGDPLPDLEVATRAAGGDRVARTLLVRRTIHVVRTVARSLCATACDADDAAQFALIEILRSAHTFRGDSGLGPWARRIAIRSALKHLQRERRFAARQQAEPGGSIDPTAGRTETRAAAGHDIEAYLARVCEVQRRAIVLHHALGHSIEECAALEGCSRNTIKSRLRLGMATLRRLMRREQNIATRGAMFGVPALGFAV